MKNFEAHLTRVNPVLAPTNERSTADTKRRVRNRMGADAGLGRLSPGLHEIGGHHHFVVSIGARVLIAKRTNLGQ